MTEQITPIAGDLLLGAGPIAKFIYGDDGPKQRRDVHAVDKRIVRLRERAGLEPFSDPLLPDEPPDAFQIIKEMLS